MSNGTALVVEGGAMRGIFSAGVLDVLLERGLVDFDLAVGTSAGACNLASFVAGQHERNFRCYTRIMSRKQLFDLPRFLRGGHFMDLDWLWTRFEEEDPLDNDAVNASRTKLLSVSTCYESGQALYHRQQGDVHNDLKGGCALPVLYRGPVYFQGRPIVDGGVSDAVPVREAYRRGARKIVVIRSRPCAVCKERSAGDSSAPCWHDASRASPRPSGRAPRAIAPPWSCSLLPPPTWIWCTSPPSTRSPRPALHRTSPF